MITDALHIPNGTTICTDICIVGGGAAGITVARKLGDRGFDIMLLEGGGLTPSQKSQSLYTGENIGTPYEIESTRSRFFGGSTNCWFAYNAPIEDHYFEKRDWVPNSGWPIGARDLARYYGQVCDILGIDPEGFDICTRERQLPDPQARAGHLDSSIAYTTIAQRATERSRFGRCFRSELERSDRIRVLLRATVSMIEVADGGREVTRVKVLSESDRGFWVQAKLFILAAGGIENPRLLLLSNTVHANGIGNQHDVVGRFFMEHPVAESGLFKFVHEDSDIRLFDAVYNYLNNRRTMFYHRLPREIEERERLLYSISYNVPVFVGDNRGVESLKYCHKHFRKLGIPNNFGQHIYNILIGSKGIASLCRYIYLDTDAAVARRELMTMIESCPNPDSRVTLSPERDRLGMNKVRLNWCLTELETRTVKRTIEILAEKFPRSGIEPRPAALDGQWASSPRWVNHHMGTTRMGIDPSQSVVDPDCRVHGMANLYVAGSSVFPSAATHAPTFTILALALRLVDHLVSGRQ